MLLAVGANFGHTPVGNFINILLTAFAKISFCQKTTNPNCKQRKVVQHFHTKKLLVKC